MDSKAECGQLNLAHIAKTKKKYKKKLKQTNACTHLLWSRLRESRMNQKELQRKL